MVRLINRGIGASTPLAQRKEFKPHEKLQPEQRRAIEFVLNSRDQVVNIQGAAGTGKTATLKELRAV
jgi:predicted ribonuclease YlaK